MLHGGPPEGPWSSNFNFDDEVTLLSKFGHQVEPLMIKMLYGM